jgi:hypothetical protein
MKMGLQQGLQTKKGSQRNAELPLPTRSADGG